MAEIGGTGYSLGKAGSSKDDDSANKSSKARKVQFTDQGDPLKTGKGGKSSIPKEVKYELNLQSELPKNAQCVMDCEAADMLLGIQEQMVFLSRDPTIKLPISFDRGLQFAKTGARYSDPGTVRHVLEDLKMHGATDGEICVIANACPETIDEVFALLPSLKAKKTEITEPLKDVLPKVIKAKLQSDGFDD
ncbi:DNA-directed RNA polymerases IV and V subunit 4-like [Silene latifolia]|uniref:DNA-directed RNA polymerases IV and V subunit 4-like n=1 Tax=Silene latifolia TaxID=37657 RepID=UPI003D77B94A